MEELLRFFPNLTAQQKEQFQKLYDLYIDWNNKINVISRKDIEHLYIHHILHSLIIYKFFPFQPGTAVLDVGTGGGFPGIPLAIMQPECEFRLVDSIGKKVKVATSVSDSIGLSNVKTQQIRAEKIKEKFHFIVSRAVMPLPRFVKLTLKLLHKDDFNAFPNGIIYLKGGDFQQELNEMNHVHKEVFNISDEFDLPYFETKKVVYIIR